MFHIVLFDRMTWDRMGWDGWGRMGIHKCPLIFVFILRYIKHYKEQLNVPRQKHAAYLGVFEPYFPGAGGAFRRQRFTKRQRPFR